jgi:hypothetical protein
LYYDTTNDVLWAYNSSWKPIAGVGTTSTQITDYTFPVYETTTFINGTFGITLPLANSVPAGHTKRFIVVAGSSSGSLIVSGSDTRGGTYSWAANGQTITAISNGSNKWWCSLTS